jgi:hypothetical protein
MGRLTAMQAQLIANSILCHNNVYLKVLTKLRLIQIPNETGATLVQRICQSKGGKDNSSKLFSVFKEVGEMPEVMAISELMKDINKQLNNNALEVNSVHIKQEETMPTLEELMKNIEQLEQRHKTFANDINDLRKQNESLSEENSMLKLQLESTVKLPVDTMKVVMEKLFNSILIHTAPDLKYSVYECFEIDPIHNVTGPTLYNVVKMTTSNNKIILRKLIQLFNGSDFDIGRPRALIDDMEKLLKRFT